MLKQKKKKEDRNVDWAPPLVHKKLDDEKSYRQVSVAPHHPNYCNEFIIAALAKPSSSQLIAL